MAQGGARLLTLLRPYKLLFAATIAATVVSSILDGFTFVLLIPFLRTLFGNAALPAQGGTHVEAVLNRIARPLLQARAAQVARANVSVAAFVPPPPQNLNRYLPSRPALRGSESV